MKAVVLAAGTGSRLGEITRARTKGMVPVQGRKLIDYLLDFFGTDFFDEILVVGGFCYEDLRDHITGRGQGNVRVIHNSEYLKGNIYTLFTALKEFSGESFLMTNVDHIYPRIMFEKMKKSFSRITAMCDFDRSLTGDDMKVKLRKHGRSIDTISKELHDFDCGYIGMTYVDQEFDNTYRNAAQAALSRYGEKAVVENILQILAAESDEVPAICDLSGFGWYEVDNMEDLQKAEEGLAADRNFNFDI